MAACANCDKEFDKRQDNKGYFRFSLEKPTTSGTVGRDALSTLTGSTFTPVSSKRHGQFLCPACWSSLNDTLRYKHSLQEFWKRTQDGTYISGKRKISWKVPVSTIKKPKFTSTPFKVTFKSTAN